MRELLLRLFRQTYGGAAVEAGIVLPIFPILIFGIFEYGSAIYQVMAVSNAAQVGANYAMLNGYQPTAIQNDVHAATGFAVGNIAVTETCGCPTGSAVTNLGCTPPLPTCTDDQTAGAYVTVSVSLAYSPALPGLPSPMTASSFVRVLQ